jgi:hypothetical protein
MLADPRILETNFHFTEDISKHERSHRNRNVMIWTSDRRCFRIFLSLSGMVDAIRLTWTSVAIVSTD